MTDPSIDHLWAKEAESRLDAYETGKIKALSLREALEKYSQNEPEDAARDDSLMVSSTN
jgi:predicted DNA-binding protein